MRRYYLSLPVFIFLLNPIIYAQSTVISGNAPSYTGEKLRFIKYKDYITYTPEVLFSFVVNPEGDFECKINIHEITEVFIDLGVYRGLLIIEPGKSYSIELPKKIEKSKGDKLNPFFEPVVFYIHVINSDEYGLNKIIGTFNDTFYHYYDHNIGNLLTQPDFDKLNNDLEAIQSPFKDIQNPFLQTYIEYKFGILRHLALQFRANAISDAYFLNKKIHYNNPSYMEFFNQVYDRYFIFYGRTDYGEKLYRDIADRSYSNLLKTLSGDEILSNDTLKELVILKNLYDGFYNDEFSHSALLEILDSLILYTQVENHRTIGLNIKEKVTKLMRGYDPPHFELMDENSSLVSNNDLKGNYIYLNFCSSSSYSCLREYELLKDLYIRHKKYIKIITVAIDEDFNSTLELKKKYNYEWTFLHYGNQPDIISQYDIRGYPTYYLIGPDGKLIFSPSPGPLENFEYYFFNLLRERGEL